MNIRLIIIATMVLAVILGFAYAMRMIKNFETGTDEINDKKDNNSIVLYNKLESWGPCPPNEICTREITVKNDGQITIIDETKHKEILPDDLHAELIQTIKDTKIMTKKCKPDEITDYSTTINISLDGKTKEISFPGCENEIEKIEAVLGKHIHL